MDYRFISEKDLEQVIKLSDYCFPKLTEHDRTEELTPLLKGHAGLGGYIDEKLVTQLFIHPFEMNVFGKKVSMGGMALVSTYPEYRNEGLTKKLLLESLKMMQEKGQLLSVLSPFSISFYRHFGWEVFFENSSYTIPADQLQLRKINSGKIFRFDLTSSDAHDWLNRIQSYHNKAVYRKNGQVYRSSSWWERINRRHPKENFAVSLDDNGDIQGYIRYLLDPSELTIHDFYTSNVQAEQELWQYIQSHASQI